MAAIMPLMVYFCMGIGKNFLTSLVFHSERFRAGDFAYGAFRRAYEHVLRDERQPRREVVLRRKDVAAFDKRDYGREKSHSVLRWRSCPSVLRRRCFLQKKYVSAGEGVFVFFSSAR
ncbi:MAG: hypothetical protein L6V85_02540 [Clostridiales bacterium]|nr:MAG: hypothetical protein L6V85_02540 [Clostridiales bacterium]